MRRVLAVVAGVSAAAMLLGGPVAASGVRPAGPRLAGARPAWVPAAAHLVFHDAFAGSTVDSTNWIACYPWADTGAGCTNSSNREQQWYLPGQAQVSGGALHLVAERMLTQGTGANGKPKTFPYRSGMIASHGKFDFRYGFVQFEARAPAGQAMWPALWMLPQDETWPPDVDLMELVGQRPTEVILLTHATDGTLGRRVVSGPDYTAGFHSYGIAWEPGSLTWYVDGVRRFRRTTGLPTKPMYLLATLAVGGTTGGPVTNASPSTASLDVRSVEVWQR